jgi:hypothetical protein
MDWFNDVYRRINICLFGGLSKMNKNKYFYLFLILIIINITSVSASVNLTNGLVTFWDGSYSSTTLIDVHGTNNGTASNSRVFGTNGIILKGIDFTKGNDYIRTANRIPIGSKSFSFWIKPNSVSSRQTILNNNAGGGAYAGDDIVLNNKVIEWQSNRGVSSTQRFKLSYDFSGFNTDDWFHIVYTWDGTTNANGVKVYVNGELKNQTTSTHTETTDSYRAYVGIGAYTWTNNAQYDFANSLIDEFYIYNRALNSEEITKLYGLPFINFTIEFKDEYDDALINNVSVTIGADTYTNTTGNTITTNISIVDDASTLYDVFVNASNYFSKTYYDINITDTPVLYAKLFQSEIRFRAFEIITLDEIDEFEVTINGVTKNKDEAWYLSTGEYTALLDYNSYKGNVSFNVSAFDNKTINITGVTDSILNISLKNAWSGNNINNFTGWISNSENGFNQSFNSASNNLLIPLKKDLEYDVFVENSLYAINNETNYKKVLINTSFQNLTFNLYSTNSIRVYVKDESNGNTITLNTTILVTGETYEETFYTSTGSYLIEGLLDGVYDIRFSATDYTDRIYSVTVTERSTQSLTVFLTSTTDTVIFTVIDDGSSKAIEGVRVSMFALVGGVWVTVESKLSDITGKVQLLYSKNKRYRFVLSHDDYLSKTFELNPVLFNTYNIRLNRLTDVSDIPKLFTVSVDFTPKFFVEEENNFTIFFNSPEGRFSEYGFLLTFPTGNYSYHGTNAIGETKTITINIYGAKFLDTVTLTYYYVVVGGEMRSYSFNFPIKDVATPNTFFDNVNQDYDLNIFERLLIVTLTILLIGGISIITAGQQLGGVVILMLFGLFSFIGFIPVWGMALVLLAGITYLTGARGGS